MLFKFALFVLFLFNVTSIVVKLETHSEITDVEISSIRDLKEKAKKLYGGDDKRIFFYQDTSLSEYETLTERHIEDGDVITMIQTEDIVNSQ